MPWEVMPDLFFYRDPEEADKEERERQEAAEAARYYRLDQEYFLPTIFIVMNHLILELPSDRQLKLKILTDC